MIMSGVCAGSSFRVCNAMWYSCDARFMIVSCVSCVFVILCMLEEMLVVKMCWSVFMWRSGGCAPVVVVSFGGTSSSMRGSSSLISPSESDPLSSIVGSSLGAFDGEGLGVGFFPEEALVGDDLAICARFSRPRVRVGVLWASARAVRWLLSFMERL